MGAFQTAGWLCLKIHAPITEKYQFNVTQAQQPYQAPLFQIHPGCLGTKRHPLQWKYIQVQNMKLQRSTHSEFL